ncbi:bifunctional diguanylate cyclase/phosphodiesterase [Pseudomonas duriflava]|nr:EAL domain-containing protein [Pseudomonas duriflava]
MSELQQHLRDVSTTPTGHTELARRSAGVIGLLVLCIFLGASLILARIAFTLNQDELNRSQTLVQKVFDARLETVSSTLLNFAYWDEAFEYTKDHIDLSWIARQESMGRTLLAQYALNGVLIIDPQDQTRFAYIKGQLTIDRPQTWLEGDLNGLIHKARAMSFEQQTAQAYFTVEGKPAIVWAAAIRPLSYPLDVPAERLSVIVFVDALGENSLSQMAKTFGLNNLRHDTSNTDVGLDLSTEPRIRLTWDVTRPGDALLMVMFPMLVLSIFIFSFITWHLLRRSIKAARQIDLSHEAMLKSEARFRDVAEASSDWIWETNAHLTVNYLSDRFGTTTGLNVNECLGKSLQELLLFDQNEFMALAHSSLRHNKPIPCRHTDVNGRERIGNLLVRRIDTQGVVSGYRGTVSDITDDIEAKAYILHLSQHDAVTGLPNRTHAYEILQEKLAHDLTEHTGFALLYVDISGFQQVNDALGHSAGDRILSKVGQRLRQIVGPDSFVARLGGDEFVILTAPLSSTALSTLCETLLDAFEQPITASEQELRLGLCIGVAQAPVDSNDSQELLRLADIALHEAKANGRRTWRLYNAEMKKRIQERRQLEQDLKQALRNDELRLVFQPRFDIASSQLIGAEALVRWEHPERGMLSPAVFIPMAEETGLIVELSDWVMHHACLEANRWDASVFVSVNLSCIEFKRSDLVDRIRQVLARTGLSPSRLELEITESVMIDNAEGAREFMIELKRLGVKLSMDDFGTGYSSLSYLSQYPFDGIKIDRSFVMNLADPTANNQAIVKAIVALGQSLSMRVTAEGVETQEQLDALATLDCDQAQGYFLGRPMPPEHLREQIAALSWPAAH